MQVIAGKYKGRKLISIDSIKTRPMLARVKESIFAMIDEYIPNSTVLDLFAGSGALGLEAISRGAKKVYFVDLNKDIKKILDTNLRRVTEDYEILISDYVDTLNEFKRRGIKFDLILLSPPYKSSFGLDSLSRLASYNLLKPNAVVAYEFETKKLLPNIEEKYIIEKTRNYGTASFVLLKYIGE